MSLIYGTKTVLHILRDGILTSVPDWTLSLVFFCKTWLLKWLNCLRVCCSAASVHPVMDGCVCADTADSLQLIHAPLMYPFAAFFRHVCSSVCCQITTLIGSFYSLLTRGTGCLLKDLTSLEWKKREFFKKLTVAPHQVAGGFSARAPPLGSHIAFCLQRSSPEFPSPGLTSEKILDPQQTCQEDVFE